MRPLVELGSTAQLAHSLEVVVPAEKLIGVEVHLHADLLAAERNDRMHEQRADAQEIERVREHLPALVEADGDMDKAVDVLRTRGLAAAAKKVGRATNEGTVMAIVSDDATKGAVVELNCETDFVGMNEKFKGYAEKIARAAMAAMSVFSVAPTLGNSSITWAPCRPFGVVA